MLRRIMGLTCAAAMLAASVGVHSVAGSQATTAALASVESRVLNPAEVHPAPDANADGEVNVLDLQRLAGQSGDRPSVPEDSSEDLPPAAPPNGVSLSNLHFVNVAAVTAAALSYDLSTPSSSAPHPALADAAPPVSRIHRFCLVPHGPPAFRLV